MNRRSFLALAAASLLALTSGALAQEGGTRPVAGERVLAIVGGEVHTGTGTVIRRGTVLIEGGKIKAVGAGLEVPEGARVIDASKRWVLPGFVAPRGEDFGVQRGRPRGNERYGDNLDPDSLMNELCLSAGVTTFFARTDDNRSNVLTTSAVLRPARGHPDLMVLKEPAALTIRWGRLQASERAQLEDQLEKTRAWIDAGKKGRPPAPALYVEALERQVPTRIAAGNENDIAQALRFAERHDLKLVLIGPYEAWRLPEKIAASGAICVITPRRRVWPSAGQERTTGSSITTAAVLEKAGAKYCVLPPGGFGSRGYGIGLGGITGRDLLTYSWEGAFAIRGGASTASALRAITLTAAEALGVDDRVGSLERGKDADIVIYQGDPFDHRFRAEMTLVAGRVVYDRSKSDFFSHLDDPRKPETEK